MAYVSRVSALLAGIVLLVVPGVRAQATTPAPQKFFLNANFGLQMADRSVGTNATETIYGEEAVLTSTHPVSRGLAFDVGGGYRVWGDVFAGVVVSRYSNTEDAAWTVPVPDPVFFDRPKVTEGAAPGLKRTEMGIYPHVGWTFPLTDKLDMAVAVGAAMIMVKQDLVTDFSVATGTQTPTVVSTTEEGTANGLFAQIDFIYNLAERVGVGGYARYAGGKVDLPSLQDHNVGGMQAGGGLRLRF